MIRQHVNSTIINSIGYDITSCTLEIKFLSGDIYKYNNLPQNLYEEFMITSSYGSFFQKYIKDHYSYRKIS